MIAGRLAGTRFIPITIGAMVGCLALSLVTVLQPVIPGAGWNSNLLILFCGLAAVEGAYSYQLYRRRLRSGPVGFMLQAVELSTLCVLRQVWENILGGHALLVNGVPALDGGMMGVYGLTSGLILLSWLAGTAVVRCPKEPQLPMRSHVSQVLAQRRLSRWVIAGGVLLLILASYSQPPLASVFGAGRHSPTAPAITVLLYGVLGLILLAQTQYAGLQRQHKKRNIVVDAGFTVTWIRCAAALAVLTVLLTLVVPNGRLLYVLQGAGGEVSAAAHALSAQPSSAVVADSPPDIHPGPPVEVSRGPRAYAEQGQQPSSDAWLIPFAALSAVTPLLKILLLWFIVLGSIIYRVQRLRRRRLKAPRSLPVPSSSLWNSIRRLWNALCALVTSRSPGAKYQVIDEQGERQAIALPSVKRPSFAYFRRLSPRGYVLRYFLRLVETAERGGIRRRPSHTPHEFAAGLASQAPEGGEDMQVLAAAFAAARYSNHEIGAEEVDRVRMSWKRSRSALRSMRRP